MANLKTEYKMSKLAALDQLLAEYLQFNYHHDPILKARLIDAQVWLKQRILFTHQDLFAQPENQLMAEYFIHHLYGGPEFDNLSLQILKVFTALMMQLL